MEYLSEFPGTACKILKGIEFVFLLEPCQVLKYCQPEGETA